MVGVSTKLEIRCGVHGLAESLFLHIGDRCHEGQFLITLIAVFWVVCRRRKLQLLSERLGRLTALYVVTRVSHNFIFTHELPARVLMMVLRAGSLFVT